MEYKPSLTMTLDELKADIERLDKQIKADRKARGLPPDPPEDFVPVAMAWTLYERCLPLFEFAVKYAQLCDKANDILDITDAQLEWVQSFRPYTELITEVKHSLHLKVLGGTLKSIISSIEKRHEYEYVGDLLKSFSLYFSFLKGDYSPPHFDQCIWRHDLEKEENEKYMTEAYEEYKRLKDSVYFDQEYERLREHYDSIKHLY